MCFFFIICEASALVHGGIHSQGTAGEAFSCQTHENAQVKDELTEEFWTQEVITKCGSTEVKLEDLHATETQVCVMRPLWCGIRSHLQASKIIPKFKIVKS